MLVGLPLSLSGGDSAQTRETRAFAARLQRSLTVPVELYDERFTTKLAERAGGRASEDSRAAAHLLEGWLARHAAAGVAQWLTGADARRRSARRRGWRASASGPRAAASRCRRRARARARRRRARRRGRPARRGPLRRQPPSPPPSPPRAPSPRRGRRRRRRRRRRSDADAEPRASSRGRPRRARAFRNRHGCPRAPRTRRSPSGVSRTASRIWSRRRRRPATGTEDTGSFETAEHELELPSGTRRVSMRDKPPVPPPPRKPRSTDGSGSPGEPRRRSPWLGRIVSLVALVLAAALIWFLSSCSSRSARSPHGQVTVTSRRGPPRARSATSWQHDGVISSSFFFKLRATLAGERSDLLPGTYHLQLGMSYGDVLHRPDHTADGGQGVRADDHRRASAAKRSARCCTLSTSPAATSRRPALAKLLNLRAYGLRHAPADAGGLPVPRHLPARRPGHASPLSSPTS